MKSNFNDQWQKFDTDLLTIDYKKWEKNTNWHWFFTIEFNKILTKFCDMCILLHKRKFNCFPHKSGSSHLSPTQTGRGKQLRFSPNILLISKHKRFPKKETVHNLWVIQSINWVLNTKNLKLVFLQKKVYLHTKEKIHHCCNIYTNTLCLQIFVVSGFAQPYHTMPHLYLFIQSNTIHTLTYQE